MAAYQEPSDKTRGAGSFAGPRAPFHVPAPLPLPGSLIDTVMPVQPIMVVQLPFNETSILECDRRRPPGNPAKNTNRGK